MEICEVYGGMLVYDRCYVGMWYVGMVIGIKRCVFTICNRELSTYKNNELHTKYKISQ